MWINSSGPAVGNHPASEHSRISDRESCWTRERLLRLRWSMKAPSVLANRNRGRSRGDLAYLIIIDWFRRWRKRILMTMHAWCCAAQLSYLHRAFEKQSIILRSNKRDESSLLSVIKMTVYKLFLWIPRKDRENIKWMAARNRWKYRARRAASCRRVKLEFKENIAVFALTILRQHRGRRLTLPCNNNIVRLKFNDESRESIAWRISFACNHGPFVVSSSVQLR